ncbi:E3 6.6kDa protein [Human adenovirus 3+7]|uniref:E3 6.6kDa protein n=1 Tax=Human adenovirus 3+7 TaxID=260047 RepID=R4HLK1_9ADEN|nr:E3 6.6kDa protein [Human adenovirus 3+7]
MILFQLNTTNTINVQTTLNHDMENHTTSYAYNVHRDRPHMALNEI